MKKDCLEQQDNLKNQVLSGFLWRFFERCGAQGVTFIVSIVLARMLEPEVYGTVALVTVFTSIMDVFVNSGMGTALIQKKDADDIDFSSLFYFNIVMCIFLYMLMFGFAPFISRFYGQPELVLIIRILSLTLIISGVKNVQQAYVSRTMQYKRFFFATLGGTIGAAIIGICMAYCGYGVWALIAQNIFNMLVDTIILWLTVKWRPKKVFSFERLKVLFSYGWKLLCSALIDTFYNNLRSLVIGKMYSSADLAYYNKGNNWPNLFVVNINSSIDSVLFPTMSREQDDIERVKNMTRKAIKISVYIMAPFLIGLAAVATPLTRLVLTEKWLPCVPYMRIFCVTYVFYPIHTANLNAIKAVGRSDLFLKLEVIKKAFGLIALMVTMQYGVMTMAYSLLFVSVISQIINSWPNQKLLNYGYIEQMKDILPSVLLSVIMGICVNVLTFFDFSDLKVVCIQILMGAVIYIAGSIILKLESFEYLLSYIRVYLSKLIKYKR